MDSSRYADLFLTESRDHLSAVNHWLLVLEREGASGAGAAGGGEAVGALFRAVHTVKGMSATMGYAAVAELTHEMETLLDRVRRGEVAVTQALMDVLFHAADVLEEAIGLAVGGRAGDADVRAAVDRLHEYAEGPANRAEAAPAAGAAPAAPAPAGGEARWTAQAPDGPGLLVRVRLLEGTPLKGVRAFMVAERVRGVTAVLASSPPLERLQADDFELDFALRVDAAADHAAVEAAARAAGFVDEVRVGEAAGVVSAAPPAAAPRPAPIGAGTAAEGAAAPRARNVRIDLERLDALMNLIGELVITRGRLAQLAAGIGDPALDETVTQASRLISELQGQIMTSRMVTVWQVFDRFPRLVRDAARSLGKDVEFEVVGKDIELDRSMLDEIGDPVVHLLRNAVDHGIETPEERRAAGKPPAGRVTLSTTRDRSAVVIRVTDDGRGIDRARVLERAKAQGLVEATRQELTDDELFRIVSRPGFSTAAAVTDLSGRGVGVDAVHTRVRALGGSVEMRSVVGAGTIVTVRLPLTLAIVRALLARVGDERYAVPLTHVSETVELDRRALRTVRGREVLVLRDEVMPLLRLRDVVRLPESGGAHEQVVLLESGERRAALVVDELTGQQEIVVKQYDAVRGGLASFSGATILGDGQPALILDVSNLL